MVHPIDSLLQVDPVAKDSIAILPFEGSASRFASAAQFTGRGG
jgi:hypothetical protein